jgi:PhnB protein
MQSINAYLIFNGNCRQAMEFYAKSLNAELEMMTYGQGPGGGPGCEIPQENQDKIMHARLSKGPAVLMASDTTPDRPSAQGNNLWVSINFENAQEIDKVFAALSENANITLPLQQTFWARRFAMLTDKFGINWMLNLEQPKTSDLTTQQPELVSATR